MSNLPDDYKGPTLREEAAMDRRQEMFESDQVTLNLIFQILCTVQSEAVVYTRWRDRARASIQLDYRASIAHRLSMISVLAGNLNVDGLLKKTVLDFLKHWRFDDLDVFDLPIEDYGMLAFAVVVTDHAEGNFSSDYGN